MFPGLLLASLGCLGCGPGRGSPGVQPRNDALHFPQGIILDPRVDSSAQGTCEQDADCDGSATCAAGFCREPAQWLIVANANSDLTYNAGTLMAVDLNALFVALADDSQFGGQGVELSAAQPCRHTELTPQLIECEESYFINSDATVHTGNFASAPAGWDCEVLESSPAALPGEARPQRITRHCPEGQAMLLTPINGDPSVNYTYLSGGLGNGQDLHFECGQGGGSDERRCSDEYSIEHMRNDPDRLRISREMVNLKVSPDPRFPYAFATHRAQGAVSLIKLDGLRGAYDPGDWRDPLAEPVGLPELISNPAPPALIDLTSIFVSIGGGSYGLAQRPCDRDDAPSVTNRCSEPLMYGSYRAAASILEFTTHSVLPADLSNAQACDGPEADDALDLVECEGQIQATKQILTGGLNTFGIAATLTGDIEFADNGEAMFVVASNPGALIRINTGVDANGETIDEPNAYIELCDRPASLALYEDGLARYALTSCYRSSEIFIIDADAMAVVTLVRAGTGPHRIVVDYARQVVYVGNTLDATISVIDMAWDSPTRFQHIARLGLQEPYSQ